MRALKSFSMRVIAFLIVLFFCVPAEADVEFFQTVPAACIPAPHAVISPANPDARPPHYAVNTQGAVTVSVARNSPVIFYCGMPVIIGSTPIAIRLIYTYQGLGAGKIVIELMSINIATGASTILISESSSGSAAIIGVSGSNTLVSFNSDLNFYFIRIKIQPSLNSQPQTLYGVTLDF